MTYDVLGELFDHEIVGLGGALVEGKRVGKLGRLDGVFTTDVQPNVPEG